MQVEIIFGPAAERELRKLSSTALRIVAKAINQLENEPRPRGADKIQGHPGFYRVRAGDFRIIYYPLAEGRLVVLVIADRKEAYRSVGGLEKRLKSVAT